MRRLAQKLASPIFAGHVRDTLRGRHFLTNYKSDAERVRFDSLTWQSAAQLVAYEGAHNRRTVSQHFAAKWGIELVGSHLPCVVQFGRRGHNRYYPLELLKEE